MTAPTASPVNADHTPLEPFRLLIHENNRLEAEVAFLKMGARAGLDPSTLAQRVQDHASTAARQLDEPFTDDPALTGADPALPDLHSLDKFLAHIRESFFEVFKRTLRDGNFGAYPLHLRYKSTSGSNVTRYFAGITCLVTLQHIQHDHCFALSVHDWELARESKSVSRSMVRGDGRVYLIARGTSYPVTPVTFLPRGVFVHVTTREQELFWFGQTARV